MKVTDCQAIFHRCRVEAVLAERRQGMAGVRVEGWSGEHEFVHARHLVIETDGRGEAPTARGRPMGGVASVAGPAPATVSPVDREGLEGSGQSVVIPLRDDRSRGSCEMPEPPTKGGPKWLN